MTLPVIPNTSTTQTMWAFATDSPVDPRTRIEQYEQQYQADYDFEQVMVHARQRAVAEWLASLPPSPQPHTVIEIGGGTESLRCSLKAQCPDWVTSQLGTWHVVDPSDVFLTAQEQQLQQAGIAYYRVSSAPENLPQKASSAPVVLHPGFFEAVVAQWQQQNQVPQATIVICSGLLHELPQPEVMLTAIHACLAPQGVLHVNVPNANSLHRQLAVAMGLMPHTQVLTERNQTLQQSHVFSMASLQELLKKTNFLPIANTGYFLKPFTHQQMMQVWPHLPENCFEGLYTLGQHYPEMASEIAITATPQPQPLSV